MVDNCEAAVARSSGTVITLIGDDDSVVKQSIEIALWMEDQQIDALVPGMASYTWPDMEHAVAINRGYNGKLLISSRKGIVSRIEARRELDELATTGAQNLARLPRLYHAFIRKSVIERLVAQIGRCFPGPVPDMSSAVAMIPHLRTSVLTDVPLVLSGQSRRSMSGRNSVRMHQSDLNMERSLPDNVLERWDPRIPRYWSGPTIWAETALKAAEAVGVDGFSSRFSFARVYANCLAFNDRKYQSRIIEAMRHGGRLRTAALVPRVCWFLFLITIKRTVTLARKILIGFPIEVYKDVAQATRAVEEVITKEDLMLKLMRNYCSGTGRE
jgi:hypothetical protein